MPTEAQEHIAVDGSTLTIFRNGNHQYWSDRYPDLGKVPGATSLTGHVDSGSQMFGAGKGYAVKQIRNNGGDLSAPDAHTKRSIEAGTAFHDEVDRYIKEGLVSESPEFLAWFHTLGESTKWVASESFVICSSWDGGFGGTIDALAQEAAVQVDSRSLVTLYDWKTLEEDHWNAYGSSLRKPKDTAQIGAYVWALRSMPSKWWPSKAYVAYVVRGENAACHVEEVNIDLGIELFTASYSMHQLRESCKDRA